MSGPSDWPVLEARQLTREAFVDVGCWIEDRGGSVVMWQGPAYAAPVWMEFATRAGTERANEGDWIVLGPDGRFAAYSDRPTREDGR